MTGRFLAPLVLLSLAAPVCAHRLDQYLQATMLSVEPEAVKASMRLIPGVAVSSLVLAEIDADQNGVLSPAEQQTYAHHVLSDLSLSLDNHTLHPRLLSVSFPSIQQMKEGIGEIHIDFEAPLSTSGAHHSFILRNDHQSQISAYLMNCLVPQNSNIQITAQTRNHNQSYYQMDYTLAVNPSSQSLSFLSALDVFPSMFRLGLRHIAEGTDHLLFLIALLLPAPLLAARARQTTPNWTRARWTGPATVRHSLLNILRVVTAFTLGHSVTLALAAFGFVSVPARPIEILIASSILVSAAHAWRPLFPGREAIIAAFFGLIHGLAFATTLQNLGIIHWQRVASLLGFNLGIETMQLIVVAALLPSLLLLSRAREYTALRLAGTLFAASASLCWIAERLFNLHTPVDLVVNAVAHRAPSIALCLFLISVVCWSLHRVPKQSMLKASAAPLLFLALCPLSAAQSMPAGVAVDAQVKKLMNNTGARGIAVALIDHGKVSYVQSYGIRNAAEDPLLTDTVMYGASLTKTVFAYTVMQLVDQVKLKLDTPIKSDLDQPLPSYGPDPVFPDKYGPYKDLAADPRWEKITPRMCLTHSTGFSNFFFIEPDQKLRIHFEPGTRFSYSGEGFILLQFVVEHGRKAQGLGLDIGDLTNANSDRLNMTHTSLVWPEGKKGNVADGWNDKGEPQPHSKRSKARAAGSMNTTIADMSKFTAALVRGDGLSPASRAEITRPVMHIPTASQFPLFQPDAPATKQRKDLYAGLGVVLFDGPQGHGFYKGGHDGQTANTMVCLESGQRCVLILSNDVRSEAGFAELVRFILGDAGVPYEWEYSDRAGKS